MDRGRPNNNQPQQTIAQLSNGSVNDRSIVAWNGELAFIKCFSRACLF